MFVPMWIVWVVVAVVLAPVLVFLWGALAVAVAIGKDAMRRDTLAEIRGREEALMAKRPGLDREGGRKAT